MSVFINKTEMIGLSKTYERINAGFSDYAELFILTNWLEEKLSRTDFTSFNIGNKMTFQYLDKGVFAIIDKMTGKGFFPPFSMVRVEFPVLEFTNLKRELLSQPNIDSISLECIGLIDLITMGIDSEVIYIEIE